MHVIECQGEGDANILKVSQRPMPIAERHDVVIKVAAAGVNRADILQRQGLYPPPADAPKDILGMEVSGEIINVGSHVKEWKTGDKVCALLAGGGYSEYVSVSETLCLPVPASLSLIDAAALPECTLTVWANLFQMGGLKQGQRALIHGGSSGIGTFAIQMAKAAGAEVFTTAGSDEKCAACIELGADYAINYKKEDFCSTIERVTKNRGVNVVLDMVGGDYVSRNLSILAAEGRHVSIAVQAGKEAKIDLWQMMRHRLTLTGSTLRHRSLSEKAALIAATRQNIWPWLLDGKVKPLIDRVFPIKDASGAHKLMESGAHIGKILLEAVF